MWSEMILQELLKLLHEHVSGQSRFPIRYVLPVNKRQPNQSDPFKAMVLVSWHCHQ